MAGIVTYGASVPRYRIRTEDIARQWGEDPSKPVDGLNVKEKTVPGPDEDTTTLSVEATRIALDRAPGIDPGSIGSIFVGSESHVYAVKPTATIIAEAVGASPRMTAADFEFACKAGTAAIQASQGLAASGMVDHGVAIGADTSQGAPGDALEYAAAAGAASFVIGDGDGVAAEINHTKSFTSDTPDFWRREGQRYPSHGGRFTGEPAYFRHVVEASEDLMAEAGTEPSDYDYAVFHQPNGKFPAKVAQKLGFNEKQYETGLLAPRIGNTYSGASLLGLANVLDIARPGDRIYLNAYGSGAGSDAFDITVTPEINELARADTPSLEEQIADKEYVDYATYAKFREKIEEAGA